MGDTLSGAAGPSAPQVVELDTARAVVPALTLIRALEVLTAPALTPTQNSATSRIAQVSITAHALLVSSSVFMNANHRRLLKQGHCFSKLIQKYHVTKVDYFIIFGVYFRSRDFIKYRYIY